MIRRALILGLVCTAAMAGPRKPTYHLRKATSGASLELLVNGAGYDGAAGTLTTAQGGSVTITRASAMTCSNDNWATFSSVTNNKPCVLGGGLWMAPATTNVHIRSEELSDVAWSKNGTISVTTTDGKVFADGATSMERITSAAVGDSISQTVTVASSVGPFTASAWFSANTGSVTSSAVVRCTGTTPSVCTCARMDGTACTPRTSGTDCIADSTFTTSNARLSVTATCAIAITAPLGIYTPGQFGTSTGTAWISGMQFEALGYATPYIQTVASTVARVTGVYSVAIPADVTDAAGCLWARFYASAIATSMRMVSFAGSNTPMSMGAAGLTVSLFDNTSAVNSAGVASVLNRTASGYAWWSGALMAAELDGVAGTAGAYDGTILGGSTMYLGTQGGTSTNNYYGRISDIKLGANKDACR